MFGNTRGGIMRGNTLSGRRKMFGWTAVAFIAAVIILCGTIHIFASSGDSRPYNKYYTAISLSRTLVPAPIYDVEPSKKRTCPERTLENNLAFCTSVLAS